MPIEYRIDHGRGIVLAKGRGIFADRDVFGYQREVWSRPDVAGYDELIDMSEVESIELPSPSRVMDLADLSARMDARTCKSRLAIVAPDVLAFGLGRMYEAFRTTNEQSTKDVAVFRTLADALAWLGLKVLRLGSGRWHDAEHPSGVIMPPSEGK